MSLGWWDGFVGQNGVLVPVEAIIEQFQEALYDHIKSATAPIVRFDENEMPYLSGSGVLCSTNGSRFLVTAAHVVGDGRDLYTFPRSTGGKIVPLTNMTAHKAQDEAMDIAIMPLSGEVAEVLSDRKSASFIPPLRQPLPDGRNLHLVGYPHSKIGVNVRETSVRLGPVVSRQTEYVDKVSRHALFDPDLHVLIYFDRKHMRYDDGRGIIAPDPHGMSGCGVWRLSGAHNSGSKEYLLRAELAGIVTDDLSKGPTFMKCLRATNYTCLANALAGISEVERRLFFTRRIAFEVHFRAELGDPILQF